jgi:hypothetical protein
MTAPNPVLGLTVGELLTDAKASLAAIETALNLVDKFAAFLPAQYRTPLEDLRTLLSTVDGFLSKI